MAKKASIIGHGKSGAAAARILDLQGYGAVDFYDDKTGLPLSAYTGEYDITVVSPGVPVNKLPVVPGAVTSEIDLAWAELPMESIVIGVTGTNGKSTVTHLTAQILNNVGVSAVACGNIGYPFGDAVLDKKVSVYVLELSSFQIELLKDIRLSAAALTNLTPDHLDRYSSYDEYVAAKLRIADFVVPEGAFISDPDIYIVNRMLKAPYKIKYVDRELRAWPKLTGHKLDFGRYYVDLNEFSLFGSHNVLNLAFALSLTACVAELDGDVTHLIKNLRGMPHRTELVTVKNGVKWINDSKATNVDSTLTALKSCEKPTILLLGGKDKKGDFKQLLEDMNRACSMVVTFGGAADLIYDQLEGAVEVPVVKSGWLKDAVGLAYEASQALGGTVILSPGCASYDEFNNFEERGDAFARYIRELENA